MREQLDKIASIKASHPGNIAMACFDMAYFQSLSPKLQERLLACVNSGIDNPDSDVGCYACLPEDYDDLHPFFSKVISRHHGIAPDARHISDWRIEDGSKLDIGQLGLGAHSLRIRVGRNFDDLPLTSAMSRADRLVLEERMCNVFQKVATDGQIAGQYVSLTPGHINEIDTATYRHLVDQHIMFKNMSLDGYLTAAGIAADWPYGRGCYYSADESFIVWVGEEDHLRIMVMQKTTCLADVLGRLQEALSALENTAGYAFARSNHYGAITTCPTNLGTGMRASIHLKLPNLTGSDGTTDKVREIAGPLGLAVRGLGGEHTPVGADGTVDISPRARLCVTEGEIVSRLYQGIARLIEAERQTTTPDTAA
ncbi:MAG: phosphagen kinase [Rhizobiaceae bacterium]